jgi:heterodisulfide reductase subunit C
VQTGVTENTPSKLKALVRDSGQEFASCYQCLKCTSGCPAVEAGDYMPHRLVRRLQWGELDEVLENSGL